MRALIRVILAVGAAAGVAACGSESGDPGAPAKRAADPKQAVVHVEGVYEGRRTSASGVIFDAAQGLALTANHAVEAAPAIFVTAADGTLMRGKAVARAQCHDFAVLELRPRPARITAIRLGDSADVGVGKTVTTLAYQPESAVAGRPPLTSVRGNVLATGVRETFTPLPPIEGLIAHQSPLTPAASGSPLVDARGRMVGINTLVAHPRAGNVKGVEYALSSNYVRRRLGELKPGRGGALGGWEAEHNTCHAALRKLIGAGHVGH